MFNAIVYVHIRQIDSVTIVISRKKVRHVLWYEVTEGRRKVVRLFDNVPHLLIRYISTITRQKT